LFAAGLVAAIVAAVLRLHLWFLVRLNTIDSTRRAGPTRVGLRSADVIFALVLLIAGIAVPAVTTNNVLGLVLIASAVAIALAFAIIEPATARAAFGEDERRPKAEGQRPK
jgi:hypothetical protein